MKGIRDGEHKVSSNSRTASYKLQLTFVSIFSMYDMKESLFLCFVRVILFPNHIYIFLIILIYYENRDKNRKMGGVVKES